MQLDRVPLGEPELDEDEVESSSSTPPPGGVSKVVDLERRIEYQK